MMGINYRKLKEVFIAALGIKPEQYNKDLKLGSVKEWDSLAHFDLLCAIEQELGVKFLLEEIEYVTTLERMKEVLRRMNNVSR